MALANPRLGELPVQLLLYVFCFAVWLISEDAGRCSYYHPRIILVEKEARMGSDYD